LYEPAGTAGGRTVRGSPLRHDDPGKSGERPLTHLNIEGNNLNRKNESQTGAGIGGPRNGQKTRATKRSPLKHDVTTALNEGHPPLAIPPGGEKVRK